MARIRTVKPDFWQDYRLAQELTRDQRLFYIALWNEADDEGRFLAHPRRLLGACFPYDEDVSAGDVRAWLAVLAGTGRIVLYEVDGEPYAQLTKFSDHQRVNRPVPSKIPPAPCGLTEDSLKTHGVLRESSPLYVEGEVEGEELHPEAKASGATPDDAPPAGTLPPEATTPTAKEAQKARILAAHGVAEADLREHQGQAAKIIREVWWKGQKPPSTADPGWSMSRELHAWARFCELYHPEEVNGGLKCAREALTGQLRATGLPMGLILCKSGRRDLIEQCVAYYRRTKMRQLPGNLLEGITRAAS